MTDVEQHKNKEFFISVAHEYIKRPGVSDGKETEAEQEAPKGLNHNKRNKGH